MTGYYRGPVPGDRAWFDMVRGQAETIACPVCPAGIGETCRNLAPFVDEVLTKQPAHGARIRDAGEAV